MMKLVGRLAAATLMLGICSIGQAGSLPPLESQKIEFLLHAVETLQDAKFVRNGTAYDAKDAVKHLRLKLRAAGSRIKTADEFILYCATSSSMSGLPYEIHFSDGRVVTSAAFLRKKLAEFPTRESNGS